MATTAKQRERWTMPSWMEKYRESFVNTGGNSVEELVNGNTKFQVNFVLAALEVGAQSQVGLLQRLHRNGALK